jgi:uncharacterized protein (TIGR00369 family)
MTGAGPDIAARFAKLSPPAASRLLGFRLIEADREAGRVVAEFTARPDFCNPMGSVQGGFLAAMLDDAMAVAALVKSDFRHVVPTLEMKVSFLAAARPGPLTAEGRVVQLGRSIAFLEGRLSDPDGRLLATASATARLVPFNAEGAAG